MNNKIVVLIILSTFLIGACSSTKQINNENVESPAIFLKNHNLINFQSKIYINAKLDNQSSSATGKIKVASTDSIQLSLFGPFGISVGKLYSDPKNLVFINPITNQVLVGTPTNSNMKAAIKVDLSYNDFIKLIRNEPPENIDSFKFLRELNDKEKLFVFDKSNNYIDYIVVKNNLLSQFQRKSLDGDLILHVFYDEFKFVDKINFPTKQVYKFPAIDAIVNIDFKEFNSIEKFDEPFSFEIPKSMELINLDWR